VAPQHFLEDEDDEDEEEIVVWQMKPPSPGLESEHLDADFWNHLEFDESESD
jgi:hypothetical protein